MKLSIVLAVSDSFDLANNLTEALNTTLKNIFSFSSSEDVNLEIIIINWNVIPEKKTYQQLDLSTKTDNVTLEYIEVSNELHNSYNLSHKIPFYLAHSINIGIRKAQNDAILVMKSGTFFSKESWLNIYNHITADRYSNTLLTLSSKAILDKSILKDEKDIYSLSLENIQNYYIKELKDKKIIDYVKKRIYLNREKSFRLFDSYIFSKNQAEEIYAYPELSIYPDLLTENLFIENIIKNCQEHITLSTGYKIYYEEKTHLNPMEDIELKLAPNTEQIIISRIKKEHNPVLFNDENWGLKSIKLQQRVL